MSPLLVKRWMTAWSKATPKTRAVLRDLGERIGKRRLLSMRDELAEIAKTYMAGPQHNTARALVMRQARRFKIELSVGEADAIATFLFSTESDS